MENNKIIEFLKWDSDFFGMKVGKIQSAGGNFDKTKFVNKRAEMYWRTREWILRGGKLERHEDWAQLTQVKYKVADSSGKLKIMSKEEMLRDGIDSPDVADSLMLTFFSNDIPDIILNAVQTIEEVQPKSLDPYA